MDRLLILDLSNITHRAIHGYPRMPDPEGRDIQGAFGAGVMALSMIRAHRPTHVIAACDSPRAQLARREMWERYKSQRGETDEAVAHQLRCARQVMRYLGIGCITEPRWEADDLCASHAASFAGEVIIVSGDKDMLALVSDRVSVHLLGRDTLAGPEQCRQLMGVEPERVCDLKALVGDSSDGFPGVPGIGPKGAVALLEAHGTLEGVLAAHARGEISGRNANALEKGRELARVSYRLAHLRADLDVHDPRPWSCARDAARAGLGEMGLGRLVDRLPT